MRAVLRIAMAALPLALVAQAQQPTDRSYRLFSGAGEEPCESLLATVRAAKPAPPLTQWCEPPVDRKDLRFSQPDWRPLDYKTNTDLIETMFLRGEYLNAWDLYEASYPGRSDRFEIVRKDYWPPLRSKVLAGFERGEAQLQVADFDIDNDGKPDRVVRMTSWDVVPSTIIDKKMPAGMRDVRYSAPCYPGVTRYRYFRTEERPDIYVSAGVSNYLAFDGYLFQFNGKTYFGIGPYALSLTKRGVGAGPSFFLANDYGDKDSCGIIDSALEPRGASPAP